MNVMSMSAGSVWHISILPRPAHSWVMMVTVVTPVMVVTMVCLELDSGHRKCSIAHQLSSASQSCLCLDTILNVNADTLLHHVTATFGNGWKNSTILLSRSNICDQEKLIRGKWVQWKLSKSSDNSKILNCQLQDSKLFLENL